MKPLLLVALTVLAFQAHAQDKYVCKRGDSERVVEVVYTNPGSQVPCEVHYTKSTGTEVLWDAKNEKGYCEAKAKAFAEKLTTLGMTCSGLDATAAEQPTAAQVQQDTAAPLVETQTYSNSAPEAAPESQPKEVSTAEPASAPEAPVQTQAPAEKLQGQPE
ncbi:hypothetical protein C0W80_15045 [Photobacterium leiognathi subsp. mandapamensis]|uniref:hypothetical protein n=1 Tax=Photobacterium leiognathi TaxID=553611 RepID=UPI000D15CC9A|nr:hypothetical protein [Photobacterium leiognathi]PSU98290.1 hypothetical protein C0W80_15045 [Photobacterium leiognathi subsp. mandapamensis]